MPIKVSCSSCSGVLHAPDDAAGKRGRCPTCGMILTIPADAPRVPDASPQPAFGIPPSQESLAFPKPPAFGDAKASSTYGIARDSTTTPGGGRLPPDPRRFGDPFAKPGQTPQAKDAEATARKWAGVDSGLGLIRIAAVLITLGVLIPSGLVIAEQNGVALPVKDGMLGIAGVGMIAEVKVMSAVVLFLLGGLFFVWGRFRVAGVPSETGVKGLAFAAALFTLISFLGYAATVGIGVKEAMNGSVPQFVPEKALFQMSLADAVEAYARQVFVPGGTDMGKIQRLAACVFLAAAIISDLWLLGTLGRLAGWLRSQRAVGRTNRFAVLAGFVLFAVPVGIVAMILFKPDGDASWNNMDGKLKETIRAGTAAFVFTVLAFLYTRSLRGVRTAIRETNV